MRQIRLQFPGDVQFHFVGLPSLLSQRQMYRKTAAGAISKGAFTAPGPEPPFFLKHQAVSHNALMDAEPEHSS
jgi:hypothetical protein